MTPARGEKFQACRRDHRFAILGVPEHQIVPMHHLGAALDAEDEQHVARGFAADFLRHPRRRRRRGRGRSRGRPARARSRHRRARSALDLDDADRQQAVAARSAATAPASIVSVPLRLERARDPFLARRDRIGRRQEPGAARRRRSRAADARRGPMRSPCGCRRWWRSCRPRSWSACRRAKAPSRTRPPSPRSRA